MSYCHTDNPVKPRYIRVFLLPLFLFLGFPHSLLADNHASSLDEETFFNELPVVISVTRLAQRYQDLPASVTVIDREMIVASGAREIPDLLRLVSGFQVGHTQNLGPRISVTYHGMSDAFARRMQVLVDGRSVYMSGTGSVDWLQLPLSMEDIERIEVVRGPNGVTYGANAFLGVINIITYHPSTVQGESVTISNGEGGYKREFIRHASQSGNLNYRVSFEQYRDDGYEDAYLESKHDTLSLRDEKHLKNVSFRGEYRAGVNDYFSLNMGFNNSTMGDGQVGDPTSPPHENASTRHTEQIKWKHVISSTQELELQLYQIKSELDSDYTLQPLSEVLSQVTGVPITPADVLATFGHVDEPIFVDQGMTVTRRDFELQHRIKPFDSLQLVWGAEMRHDKVQSDGLLGNQTADDYLYRLFMNGEWQLHPRWTFNAGAMAEKNDITGTHVSPRVAINHRLTSEHSLRAAYTVSYRTPSLLEEYADYAVRFNDGVLLDQVWKSAGGLSAEKISSTEIGLVGASNDQRYSYDIRLFREHLRDLIAAPMDRDFTEPYSALCLPLNAGTFCEAGVFINDGSADMEGYELQLRLRPIPSLLVSLGYSRVRATGTLLNRLEPLNVAEYQTIESATPKNTASLLLAQTWPRQWQTSLGVYYISEMEYIGGDKTDGVTTADIRIARDFSWQHHKGSVALTVTDILGAYYDFEEAVTPTQRASLSLGLSF